MSDVFINDKFSIVRRHCELARSYISTKLYVLLHEISTPTFMGLSRRKVEFCDGKRCCCIEWCYRCNVWYFKSILNVLIGVVYLVV